jgi:hypothetical protein
MFDVLVAVFAVVGQICHIVKKRTQEGADEISVFRKWVLNRPFNTLIACIAAIAAAHAVQVPNGPVMESVIQAFLAGFTADSIINRSGK